MALSSGDKIVVSPALTHVAAARTDLLPSSRTVVHFGGNEGDAESNADGDAVGDTKGDPTW